MLNLLLPCLMFLSSCLGTANKRQEKSSLDASLSPIAADIFTDPNSFYYIDFSKYGEPNPSLPIGIFDSGTGGLTVLDALVRFDQNINQGHGNKPDGLADFRNEEFIYLADQANMPYGNYYSENKSDLLIEHIIKDAQFLLGEKYYPNILDKDYLSDKKRIKALVIACNTATAYGQEEVDEFIERTGIDIPVIGVINAGARGALASLGKEENGAIGVFATVGTIKSKGYENTLLKMKRELGYTGNLKIYNQGGHGVAEAVDEEPDFISRSSINPRKDYRGPSLDSGQFKIDKALMDVYNFDFDQSKMLCDEKNMDDCQILQINSTDNYIRYHLVSLMEKIRADKDALPLKVLLLGCTHYPYLISDIKKVLGELYDYKREGEYLYRNLMAKEVILIDPAEFVAKELYEVLDNKGLISEEGSITNSEFFISVPNLDNKSVEVDEQGRFTYNYKYGRNAGEIQEYVKVVPFSRNNISDDVISRFKSSIPKTFELIQSFNAKSKKVEGLPVTERIK